MSTPGTTYGGVGVFGGDDWDRFAGGDLSLGGYGFVTVVHEVLHGLGMAHPHDGGGSSSIMPGVTSNFDDYGDFNLNQGIYTAMTYNSGYHTGGPGTAPTGTVGVNYGFEAGPMALDIGVLQALYGANTTHNNTATNYFLPTGAGVGTYWSAIWDTGGLDAIRHTGAGAARIDLRAATLQMEEGGGGYISGVNGVAGGYTIANGVVIEQAFGNNASDYLVGNAANNRLVGYGGFDTIFGGAGNDLIEGGNGADRLLGQAGNDQILGGFGADNIEGGDGNDTINSGQNADRVFGGNGADLILGGGSTGFTVDGLFGQAGNDRIYGQAGFDLLDGGIGNDFLDGGHQADNLYGGNGDDTMVGDLGFDRLFGGFGNDIGYGGDGTDALFGMGGNDRLYGQGDNDRIFGGTGNDLMFGHAGNDTLWGGAGFDTMNGGSGNDILEGNFNADTFVFTNNHGNDTITDFAATNTFERLDFSGLSSINNLFQALSAATQVGANTVINTGTSSITLNGVNRSDLDASDFIF
ncbi:M10 family metallopeptidase C-terminal domain-containing protein [Sulfitobacter aestuariivivens]|uniref:M10 family metallopeptidase C-terminal domain-containing protein n=1 Tax=Sulfitobacter aestuariivivens TaxID=2766981 RepID=UPI00360914E1